jgi:hypothetical protein
LPREKGEFGCARVKLSRGKKPLTKIKWVRASHCLFAFVRPNEFENSSNRRANSRRAHACLNMRKQCDFLVCANRVKKKRGRAATRSARGFKRIAGRGPSRYNANFPKSLKKQGHGNVCDSHNYPTVRAQGMQGPFAMISRANLEQKTDAVLNDRRPFLETSLDQYVKTRHAPRKIILLRRAREYRHR